MFQVNPIDMKNQALFSSRDKSKKLKCRLLHFLFGALRVKLLSKYALKSVFSFHRNKSNGLLSNSRNHMYSYADCVYCNHGHVCANHYWINGGHYADFYV